MKNLTEVKGLTTLDKTTTEDAIALVKTTFLSELCNQLNLRTVSAPVVVLKGTGVNDDLNGVERAVGFPIKDMNEQIGEVVHSLAKWKRMRLKEYDIQEGKGIVTDMRALRPDEEMSAVHSISVDQFDWEQHISKEERSIDKLKSTVKKIYSALKFTEQTVFKAYPDFLPFLPEDIVFIHTEELLEQYPELTPKEREYQVAKQYGAVFIIGIGGALADGKKHDGRAPDYDDWSTETGAGQKGLNGDILVWNPVLKTAFELSSMGIRVDESALLKQLELEQCPERKSLHFHDQLLQGQLPQSIGGGIGQSRLAMLLLKKRHIGEVQVSIWSDKVKEEAKKEGYQLL
jgi:aspartate--ammonia ligase